jgi:hypothetical protein
MWEGRQIAELPLADALVTALLVLAVGLAAACLVALVAALGEWLLARLGARRRAGEGHAMRYYVGRRERTEAVVFIVDAAVRRLTHAGHAGPFGWGRADAGGLHLAHSLLEDVLGGPAAREHVERFLDDVVVRLPSDGFVLSVAHVQRWLARQTSWRSRLRSWAGVTRPAERDLRARVRSAS